MTNLIIEPQKGFGDIKFGMKIEKIIETLGEPEDVDNFENDADINAVLLHYWQKGFSLFFQGDTNQVLAGIETDHPDATLFGVKVINMPENEIVDLMKKHGYEDFDRETDEDEVRLSYEEQMLDFYIKDNKVAFVNWDVLIDDEGNILK